MLRKAGLRVSQQESRVTAGLCLPPTRGSPQHCSHLGQKEIDSSRPQSVHSHFLLQACTPNHSDVSATGDLTQCTRWKMTVGPGGVGPALQSPSPTVNSLVESYKRAQSPGLGSRPPGVRARGRAMCPSPVMKGFFEETAPSNSGLP